MKSESWIWVGLKVALVVAGLAAIAVGLKYILAQTNAEAQAEIDTWVNQRVAEALSKKLNQPVQAVEDALKDSTTSPLAKQIEQVVQSVTVTFQRLSSSKFQIQLDLLYTSNTAFSTTVEKEWDDLPTTVRGEFLKTGHQTICRTWSLFPNQLDLRQGEL